MAKDNGNGVAKSQLHSRKHAPLKNNWSSSPDDIEPGAREKQAISFLLIGTVSNTITLWWGLQYVNLGWSTNQSITHGYSKWPNEHSFNFYSFKKFIHKKRWLEKHVSKMEICRGKIWFHIWNQKIHLWMIRNSLQAALLIFTFTSKLIYSLFFLLWK